MLKKILWLTLVYIVFKIICFIFHFSFIRTGLIPVVDNDKGNFIMKVFNLLLVTIFLFKNNELKKAINFSKAPQKANIATILSVLIIYIFFVVTNTIFFYYNHNISSSPILPLKIINTLILAPVLEEILYRGIMINYLLPTKQNKRWHIVLCFVVVSLLFSLMHNNFEFYHFIHHFIFSLIISALYYYQRNIYTVILFHILFNLFTITFNSYQLDLTQLSLNKEWFLIGSLIFLGLTIYTLFRLAKSYRNQ